MVNIKIHNIYILDYCIIFFNPIAEILCLDGAILLAFILSIPANELVIPVLLMAYQSNSTLTEYASISELGAILLSNNWTEITAVCFLLMYLFHSPCSTTLLTIKKETKSIKLTLLAVLIPTVIGVIGCALVRFFTMIT